MKKFLPLTFLFLLFSGFLSAQLDTSKICAYLPFEGGYSDASTSGVEIQPSSDPEATGTLQYGKGMYGQAGVFDLSPLVTSALNFRASQSFTISTWINMEKLPSEFNTAQWWIHQKDGSDDPGRIHLEVTNYDPNSISTFTSGKRMSYEDEQGNVVALQANTWYHVAHVKDVAAGKRYLYVNGDLVNTIAKGNEQNKEEWVIGGPKNESVDHMIRGGSRMDDLLITQQALEPSQISDIMNKGLIGCLGTLVSDMLLSCPVEGDSIEIGQAMQIQVDIYPADATVTNPIWRVKNGTGEASVDQQGVLTAQKPGDIQVIAAAHDGSAVEDTLDIMIYGQSVEEIRLFSSSEDNSVEVGSDLQIYADVSPDQASDTTFTWDVAEGTGYAEIDQNGLLTALSPGSVTVIAQANDGSGVTGQVEVTISIVEVTDITLSSGNTGDSVKVDETLQIYVDVSPDHATYKSVSWSVEDGTGNASIDIHGLLTPSYAGEVTVVATADDGSEVQGTLEVTIYREESATGFAHVRMSDLKVYPNPSDEVFQVALPQGKRFEYAVYDLSGIKIQSGIINSSVFQLKVTDGPGIYHLQLKSPEGQVENKLIVY